MIVRVEYLQNILIAERLLHLQGGHTDDGELLLTSFEMVGLTLKVWTHKDRFAEAIEDFEWLVNLSRLDLARKTDELLGHELRCTGRWYPEHGAAAADLLGAPSSTQSEPYPFSHHPEAESTRGIP